MAKQDLSLKARLASRLREARKLAGLSQGQAAKLLNLHRPTITEIESGNRNVTAGELSEFAKTYDVSVSWLIGEAPDEISENDPSLQLAARELAKLKPQDLQRLLRLLSSMRGDQSE